MQAITSNRQFNELVKSGKPFVLDFYADWCGPCQMLLPTMEALAEEFDGKVEIMKVNVDTQTALAQKFQVRSIPALFFLKSNKVKASLKGMASEHQLRGQIQAML